MGFSALEACSVFVDASERLSRTRLFQHRNIYSPTTADLVLSGQLAILARLCADQFSRLSSKCFGRFSLVAPLAKDFRQGMGQWGHSPVVVACATLHIASEIGCK